MWAQFVFLNACLHLENPITAGQSGRKSKKVSILNSDEVKVKRRDKLIREIKRIGRQAAGSGGALFDRFLSTHYYDLVLSKSVVEHGGMLPLNQKVAVYLMFPSPHLRRGHLHALEYIVSQGYSPIVVSNGDVSAFEVEALTPLSHKIIVRPNHGYDFGGYRDGMKWLSARRTNLTHLALFNDSTWFPLPESQNWLEEAEATGGHFVGALSHGDRNWLDIRMNTSTITKRSLRHQKLFHYCSFALLFTGTAIQDDNFWRFWKQLRISSSKARTIRYGERALSSFMFKSGHECRLTLSEDRIVESLLGNPAFVEAPEVLALVRDGGWPAYSLRELLWENHSFMFLKKSLLGKEIRTSHPVLNAFLSEMNEAVKARELSETLFAHREVKLTRPRLVRT